MIIHWQQSSVSPASTQSLMHSFFLPFPYTHTHTHTRPTWLQPTLKTLKWSTAIYMAPVVRSSTRLYRGLRGLVALPATGTGAHVSVDFTPLVLFISSIIHFFTHLLSPFTYMYSLTHSLHPHRMWNGMTSHWFDNARDIIYESNVMTGVSLTA